MATDPAKSCETLVDKIQAGKREITDDRDRKLLLDLNDRLQLHREEYSDYRRLKILRHGTRMAEHAGCLTDALEDREDQIRGVKLEGAGRSVPCRVAASHED